MAFAGYFLSGNNTTAWLNYIPQVAGQCGRGVAVGAGTGGQLAGDICRLPISH